MSMIVRAVHQSSSKLGDTPLARLDLFESLPSRRFGCRASTTNSTTKSRSTSLYNAGASSRGGCRALQLYSAPERSTSLQLYSALHSTSSTPSLRVNYAPSTFNLRATSRPPPSRQPTKFQQSSLRLEVLECRKRRTSCFPHMALAPRSVGAASGTDAGRCLAGSLGAARLPTRRRAAMAPPQRLPLLGSRPGAAEIGAPSHRLQHPRGSAALPTPPRPANSIGRAVVIAPGQKCRRRRAVP